MPVTRFVFHIWDIEKPAIWGKCKQLSPWQNIDHYYVHSCILVTEHLPTVQFVSDSSFTTVISPQSALYVIFVVIYNNKISLLYYGDLIGQSVCCIIRLFFYYYVNRFLLEIHLVFFSEIHLHKYYLYHAKLKNKERKQNGFLVIKQNIDLSLTLRTWFVPFSKKSGA